MTEKELLGSKICSRCKMAVATVRYLCSECKSQDNKAFRSNKFKRIVVPIMPNPEWVERAKASEANILRRFSQ